MSRPPRTLGLEAVSRAPRASARRPTTARLAAHTAASAAGPAAGPMPRRRPTSTTSRRRRRRSNLKIVPMARVLERQGRHDGRPRIGVLYLKGGGSTSSPRRSCVLAALHLRERPAAAALEVEGLSRTDSRTTRPGRQALHGPRPRLGRCTGCVHGPAAEPLQRHDRASSRRSTTGRRQLRPHRPRLHRRRHGERDHGGQADRNRRTLPPERPAMGVGLRQWLSENADSVGGASAQMEVLSYEDNYLDLDPSVTRRPRPAGHPHHVRPPARTRSTSAPTTSRRS